MFFFVPHPPKECTLGMFWGKKRRKNCRGKFLSFWRFSEPPQKSKNTQLSVNCPQLENTEFLVGWQTFPSLRRVSLLASNQVSLPAMPLAHGSPFAVPSENFGNQLFFVVWDHVLICTVHTCGAPGSSCIMCTTERACVHAESQCPFDKRKEFHLPGRFFAFLASV